MARDDHVSDSCMKSTKELHSSNTPPIIDLSGLRSGGPLSRRRTVDQMRIAAEEWGSFQVVNHSVSTQLVERMYEQSRLFFSLPPAVKELATVPGSNDRRVGYTLTSRRAGAEVLKLKESLADFSYPDGNVTDMVNAVWKDNDSQWSVTLREYCAAVKVLGCELLEILAEGLGLEKSFFSSHFEHGSDGIGLWRVHYFPPHGTSEIRTPPHSDPDLLTILKQNIGDGLQVKKPRTRWGTKKSPLEEAERPVSGDDPWIDVEPFPGSFVIIVGDLLEAWSNGRFPVLDHRVIMNENRERFSTVNFFDAGPSMEIRAPPELIDEHHPARFVPFLAGEYQVKFQESKRRGCIKGGEALDYLRIAARA